MNGLTWCGFGLALQVNEWATWCGFGLALQVDEWAHLNFFKVMIHVYFCIALGDWLVAHVTAVHVTHICQTIPYGIPAAVGNPLSFLSVDSSVDGLDQCAMSLLDRGRSCQPVGSCFIGVWCVGKMALADMGKFSTCTEGGGTLCI
jgi:hypothetical protein